MQLARTCRRLVVAATAAAALTAAAAPAAHAITLPAGFEESVLATDLTAGAVSIDWAPDGRMFIAHPGSGGTIHIFNPGSTTTSKIINLTGNVYGIAVDSQFASNGYLYAVRSFGGNTTNRLVRVRVKSDNTLENPTDPQTVLLGSVATTPCPAVSNTVDCITATSPHDIDAVRSDPRDGTLWVSVGDGSNLGGPGSFQAQDERSLHGKILHVDRNGRGVPGHPFCPGDNDLGHNCTKVAATGFRNPFRFTLRPGGNPIVGDVGWSTREELDLIVPGRNYGWPCYEGTIRTPNYRDNPLCAAQYAKEGTPDAAVAPIHDYAHTALGAAVTGGPTYTGSTYPAEYAGNLFFGDYVNGFIKRLQLDASGRVLAVRDFATGVGALVDLQQAPNGDLVYVLINGTVKRIRFNGGVNRAPVARIGTDRTSGQVPLRVAFRGADSSDPDADPITYDWNFGDGTAHSTQVNPVHNYTVAGTYTARLTVRDPDGATNSTTTTIVAGNDAPVLSITAPQIYRAGQTLTVRGSAADPEDGPLPTSALRWRVKLIHVDHEHDPNAPSGVSETSFAAPLDHDADSHFEVTLSATDSGGATGSKTVSILPDSRTLTIDSTPPGAPITFAGRDYTAPLSKPSAIGFRAPVSAAERFSSGGRSWEFESWSDGGARLHEITVPASDSTLVARYREVATNDVSFEAESMSGILSTGNARNVASTTASGGREVLMIRNATISKTQLLPAAQRITVRARGDQCSGAPIMLVKVDGAQVMSVPVPNTAFADFSAAIGTAAGSHAVTVAFTNDFGTTCDRNLRVDKVTFSTGVVSPPPPPPSTGSSFEAETMGPLSSTGNARSVANTTASGGREVLMVRNASVSRSLSLPASSTLTVRARGDQCLGAPLMVVSLDGTQVMSVPVPVNTFGDYSTPVGITAGTHAVAVAFINDYAKGCDRNLRVDKITVSP